ncbi:hypothetical protein C1645_750814, partial [Glomus cerebriforme]
HFLNKSMSGSCMIEISDVKPGKNHSIAYAIFKQPKNDDIEEAEIKQWAKFTDKRRKLDLLSLGLFSHHFSGPPGYIRKEVLKGDFWYPTLTLEIQFKNIPKGQWVVSSFRSRFLQNGRNEVDGEITYVFNDPLKKNVRQNKL